MILAHEPAHEHLAHVVQFTMLATELITGLRRAAATEHITLPVADENALLDLVHAIEERAKAALATLPPVPPPDAYLAGTEGPAKLQRFYGCTICGVNHWEEQPVYVQHILSAVMGIRYGHRPALGLVR